MVNEKQLINECIKRMGLLKVDKRAIEELLKGRILMTNYKSQLDYPTNSELELIKKFESENNSKVYYAIRGVMEIVDFLGNREAFDSLILLSVSQYKDEWDYDIEDIKEGYPLAYVYNLNDSALSEWGSVKVVNRGGVLFRVG